MPQLRIGHLASFGFGISAMYFLDPIRGRRRRAMLRDQGIHFKNRIEDMSEVTARDLVHRTAGTIATIRSRFKTVEPVEDDVLLGRIRSKLGRLVSHPRSVEVAIGKGRVILRGHAYADEVNRLVFRLRRLPGVEHVENQLAIHDRRDHDDTIGGSPDQEIRRSGQPLDLFQSNWAPATRFLVGMSTGVLGLAAAVYGARHRSAA